MANSDKARLLELLEKFCDERLSVDSFCDQFTELYNLEIDYDELSEEENQAFSELIIVTSRFSPFQEDLERWDCYFNDSQVREKAKEVFERVNPK